MDQSRRRPNEIAFRLDESLTVGRVWTFFVDVPGYMLKVMANEGETSPDGKQITLSGVHMDGPGPNEIGVPNLRMIGDRFCEVFGYDELVVQGASRTTGASPERSPGHLRFKRGRATAAAGKSA